MTWVQCVPQSARLSLPMRQSKCQPPVILGETLRRETMPPSNGVFLLPVPLLVSSFFQSEVIRASCCEEPRVQLSCWKLDCQIASGHSEKTSLCLCVPVNESGKMQLLGDAVLGWYGSRNLHVNQR